MDAWPRTRRTAGRCTGCDATQLQRTGGGPGHGRATARRECRLRWWPDSQTGVLLLLAVLTWEKKVGPKRPRRSPLARLITSDVCFHLTSPVFS
jgi:hypothetical protein